MPESLQLFFKTDSSTVIDPKNSSLILPGESCLLRYGVEKSENKSFIACFAYYYAYKNNKLEIPTIKEMSEILIKSITLDMFIQYHNGNLVSIFRPKIIEEDKYDSDTYKETDFYKTINLDDETQKDYLEDTIASYENFQDFIRDDNSVIDHTYMWDFFCNRNDLLLDGMNLVILQISDNDITERVQMICPSNAYSPVVYNSRKETVILVKQDMYYEPIHLYKQLDYIWCPKLKEKVYTFSKGDSLQGNKVIDAKRNIQYTLKTGEEKKEDTKKKKAFLEIGDTNRAIKEIKNMLKIIQATTDKYCLPLPSMPRKYLFKHNIPTLEVIRILKKHHYQVTSQVLNYRNKSIGVLTKKKDNESNIFVPSFPSAIIPDIDTKYMDDNSLWIDYKDTRDRLDKIAKDTTLFTKLKVKIVEDGLVIGFLTETNQFVQINPPIQPIDEDEIDIG